MEITMEAHARRSDPETSHEAAESVDAGTHLFKVYDWLRAQRRASKPFDREELADAMKKYMSPQSARSRLSELMQAGLVHDTGNRRTTAQGRSQQVLWPSSGLVLLPWPDIMQKVLDARAVKQEHAKPLFSVDWRGSSEAPQWFIRGPDGAPYEKEGRWYFTEAQAVNDCALLNKGMAWR